MAQRLITEAIDDINALIEASYSVEGITYYNLAKRIPKNEGIAVIARDGRNISGSLVELKKSNKGVIYHRIIEQKKDKTPGKGRDSVLTIRTTLRLVAWIKRPQGSVARKDWDDQELMNECAQIVNSNSWADKSEIAKVTSNSSDYLGILEEEIGIVDKNKKLPYELTLFTIDYEVVQKQRCSYKTGQTVTAITSLSVSPSNQEGTSGSISDITITTDQPANISIPNLPSNLNLTQLSNTQWKITGTFSGSSQQFGVIAQGIAGGLLEQCVNLTIPSSSTPVTGLSYTNDAQTIWQNTGSSGVFTAMEAQPTPSNATGSYSSIDLPDGLSLNSSTGEITVSDFSLVPSGASNFTVTITGSSGFTGSASANLSVTKNTLWTPSEPLEVGNIVYGFNADDGITLNSIFPNLVDSWEDEYGSTGIANFTNSSRKCLYTTNGGQNILNSLGIRQGYLVDMGSDIDLDTDDFYSFFGGKIDDTVQGTLIGTTNNQFEFPQLFGSSNDQIGISGAVQNDGGGASFFSSSFDDFTFAPKFTKKIVVNTRVNSGQFQVRFNDDLAVDITPSLVNTFIPQEHQIGGYQNFGQVSTRFILAVTNPNQNDIDRITGWMAWDMNIQDELPLSHPYKNLPPFI